MWTLQNVNCEPPNYAFTHLNMITRIKLLNSWTCLFFMAWNASDEEPMVFSWVGNLAWVRFMPNRGFSMFRTTMGLFFFFFPSFWSHPMNQAHMGFWCHVCPILWIIFNVLWRRYMACQLTSPILHKPCFQT